MDLQVQSWSNSIISQDTRSCSPKFLGFQSLFSKNWGCILVWRGLLSPSGQHRIWISHLRAPHSTCARLQTSPWRPAKEKSTFSTACELICRPKTALRRDAKHEVNRPTDLGSRCETLPLITGRMFVNWNQRPTRSDNAVYSCSCCNPINMDAARRFVGMAI